MKEYFPLREIVPRKLQHPNYRIVNNRIPVYWIISLALFVVIALWMLYKNGKKRYLRRDPSMWGYMTLLISQDQLYMQP
ncbi:unnamed protein product [Onchocerca flexuosa]|uniref:Cytochrome b n=1 Tax=Onchocerca flexuosa TaxID=387005 RepID=A0A183HIF1_9BILA|nr:unnamed protein product [Onchocerca flexuosa]